MIVGWTKADGYAIGLPVNVIVLINGSHMYNWGVCLFITVYCLNGLDCCVYVLLPIVSMGPQLQDWTVCLCITSSAYSQWVPYAGPDSVSNCLCTVKLVMFACSKYCVFFHFLFYACFN